MEERRSVARISLATIPAERKSATTEELELGFKQLDLPTKRSSPLGKGEKVDRCSRPLELKLSTGGADGDRTRDLRRDRPAF